MTIVHWNVIHCPNVYSSAWASALFILGRWACEGLVRGINDEFEIPALLFLCFLGLVNLVRCRYPPKFKVKTTQKKHDKKQQEGVQRSYGRSAGSPRGTRLRRKYASRKPIVQQRHRRLTEQRQQLHQQPVQLIYLTINKEEENEKKIAILCISSFATGNS